jgi:hypothetical protein
LTGTGGREAQISRFCRLKDRSNEQRGWKWREYRGRNPGMTLPIGTARGLQAMASWTVQLLTILGVSVGAVLSFVFTRLTDRARWQRDEALRWDTRRLDCYGEFAASIKHHITTSQRICAGLDLASTDQPLGAESGLAMLADAEQDLGIKWEHVLMLGTPTAIEAARDWRHLISPGI